MTAAEIDEYLAPFDDAQRATLEQLRRDILALRPDAEQCISYGMPAFRVQGQVIAGFAAFKHHLSYLPHSGSVLSALGAALDGYQMTPGSLHFAVGEPLPPALVERLIATRLEQAGLS